MKKNLIEEIRELVKDKPVKDVFGLLTNQTFRTCPSPAGRMIIIEFDCWRLQTGVMNKKTLILRGLLGSQTNEERVLTVLLPRTIVHVKVKLNNQCSLGLLDHIVGKYSLDEEMNEYAHVLNNPANLEDSDLGILTWDNCCAFVGQCTWNDKSINLLLDLEDIRDFRKASILCDRAKAILKSQDHWKVLIQDEILNYLGSACLIPKTSQVGPAVIMRSLSIRIHNSMCFEAELPTLKLTAFIETVDSKVDFIHFQPD